MASYRVTLRADKQKYPVLLSNGNLVESGDLAAGRHFTKWNDPFRKPGHLFALVAANLVCNETSLRSASGKEKLLQVWVAPQDLGRTDHRLQICEAPHFVRTSACSSHGSEQFVQSLHVGFRSAPLAIRCLRGRCIRQFHPPLRCNSCLRS